MEKKPVTVGAKEGLGAGIIGLGLMLIFLPSMAEKISQMEGVTNTAFGITTGSVLVLAVLVMIAGLAVILVKPEDETD